ncbi:hypothetical protein CERZMDRAFT_89526 [Cercospora zeae-maydis SCOH1-5]|uniref:Uncharacterized protein n=1 Tax=Cercospora zeae-maydis SCOH1-5 TaxID=717836 RepID=A0A6A6FVM2_9PEZI|nr:hypothetical protein CERZMDRAFT_89526 [Cercospora zeae-maydis SCOH1-5]
MEALQREKINLAEQEVRIQRSLKETAEKFEALRKEKGIEGSDKSHLPAIEAPPAAKTKGDSMDVAELPAKDTEMAEPDHEEENEDDKLSAFGGIGLGAGRPNSAGLGLGFARTAEDNDSS